MALHEFGKGTAFEYRGSERFAMCSTFKFALAAMTLEREGLRGRRLAFAPEEILSYAPYTKERAQLGWMSALEAARHSVTLSDNTAANLLLAELGGPEGFTAWVRSYGDTETRLDRTEPSLNENAPDDPRDTTTPRAHARLVAELLETDRLSDEDHKVLGEWLVQSSTGRARLRAGLPEDWNAGNKTGTCGAKGRGEVNDIAVFTIPGGRSFALAAYLDGAKGGTADAEAILADVARKVAIWLTQTGA